MLTETKNSKITANLLTSGRYTVVLKHNHEPELLFPQVYNDHRMICVFDTFAFYPRFVPEYLIKQDMKVCFNISFKNAILLCLGALDFYNNPDSVEVTNDNIDELIEKEFEIMGGLYYTDIINASRIVYSFSGNELTKTIFSPVGTRISVHEEKFDNIKDKLTELIRIGKLYRCECSFEVLSKVTNINHLLRNE